MSQLNCIIIKFKNIYSKFVNERGLKFCIISSLFIFLLGLFIAKMIAVNFAPLILDIDMVIGPITVGILYLFPPPN
jgi:hypothetical protein